MRPSLRFLALAVVGWIGIRAAALGMLPGAQLFRIEPGAAKTPPIIPTQFPTIEPVALTQPEAAPIQYAVPSYVQPPIRPVMVPIYYSAPVSRPVTAASTYVDAALPSPRHGLYASSSAFDDLSISRLAAVSAPASAPVPVQVTPAAPPSHPGIDRWQLSSWALLRNQDTGVAGSPSLASGGQLGASQAGARLLYNFNRRLAIALRTSTEVGRRGGEVAAGVRVQPIIGLPIWLNAERRQRIGRFGGGRNDFALFAEAGLYQRPLPGRFKLDSYLQGGVVGVKTRDLFVDGALTVTRPVYRNASFGFGVWGGAQPGLSRLDAGPTVAIQLRRHIKVRADWRQKLAGNAHPGSGPALTLSGDF